MPDYAIARPFTYTDGVGPDYTESVVYLYYSAHQYGVFADFGPTSGYDWWNGPNETRGYVFATYVSSEDHSTPDGNVGNVQFWRTRGLNKSLFTLFGSRILGSNYVNDYDVYGDLEGNGYWTSYKYSIFYGGDFTSLIGEDFSRFGVLRITDGQLDLQPNDNSWGNLKPDFDGVVYDIYHRSNGDILVSGNYTESFGNSSRPYFIQINTTSFTDDGVMKSDTFDGPVYKSVYNDMGEFIVCVGGFTTYDLGSSAYITAIADDGSGDGLSIFGSGLSGVAYTIDQVSDSGLMLVGGSFNNYNGNSCKNIVAIKPSGSILADVTINAQVDSVVRDIKVSSDNTYFIAVGEFTGAIMKFDLVGVTVSNIFAQFNSRAFAVDISPGGSIIVGGQFSAYGVTSSNCICKINADGSIDQTFTTNIGTGFNGRVLDVQVLPDSSILVGGQFTSFNGSPVRYIAKLSKSGLLIPEWDDSSETGAGGPVNCISPR